MVIKNPGKQRRRWAFSLLELLAVVTILGVIAAIIIPRISGSGMQAKRHMCDQFKSDLNSALERYWFDHGRFPSELDDLRDADYYPETIPVCPANNKACEFDKKTGRTSGHLHT